MMLKAVLAWAGIMAVHAPVSRSDHPRNEDAHAAANREQAIFAGTQVLVRKSARLADVMASDPCNSARIGRRVDDMRGIRDAVVDKQSEVRAALDGLSKRLG